MRKGVDMAANEIQRIPTPRMPADLGLEEQRMQDAHRKVQQVYEGTVETVEDNSFQSNVGDFIGNAWIFLLLGLLVVFVSGSMMSEGKGIGVGAGVKAVWAVISGIFKGIVGVVKFVFNSFWLALMIASAAVIFAGIYIVFF